MAEAEAVAVEGGGSPLTKAADRIRASAQYLLGAFAAVGATLAAGLQLADIGDVSLVESPLRAVSTIIGLLAAVVGIAVAIAAAASVSTASHVDLPWLIANDRSKARAAVEGDMALRQGRTVGDLRDQVDAAVTASAKTYGEIVALGDPGSDASKQQRATALRARYGQEIATASHLKRIRSDVLEVASYHRTRAAYEDAKKSIVFGAVAAAVGIAAFAWGANGPEVVDIDPGEILPKSPSEVTVILTNDGIAAFGDQLGSACDPSAVDAIVF
nr:hypothetical protein [Acidimicrobiia bacterium]